MRVVRDSSLLIGYVLEIAHRHSCSTALRCRHRPAAQGARMRQPAAGLAARGSEDHGGERLARALHGAAAYGVGPWCATHRAPPTADGRDR